MRYLSITLMLISVRFCGAQTAWELADKYISGALTGNCELEVRRADVDISRSNTAEARGAFFPTIDFKSRHTWSDGGRVISIDVNDFMPPAVLPVDVPPREIPFIREREQETKISLALPLFTGGGTFYNYLANSTLLS